MGLLRFNRLDFKTIHHKPWNDREMQWDRGMPRNLFRGGVDGAFYKHDADPKLHRV